ncbi:MAG: hypothetical protein ACLTRS_08285 [Lachnospiraceae bacterium]
MVETRPDKYSWQMKFNYNKLDAEEEIQIQIGTQQSQIWHLERVCIMDWIWKATMQEQMQSTH